MSKTFIKLLVILCGVFLVAFAFITTIKSLSSRSGDTKIANEISIQSVTGGSSVKINNPARSTNFADMGSNVYVSDERQLGNDIGFSVAYFEEDGSFAISITGAPLAEHHQKASHYLLETLQISEEEACKLNVYVGVTYDIDPNLSGKNFGLSFCPGSVQL